MVEKRDPKSKRDEQVFQKLGADFKDEPQLRKIKRIGKRP